MHHETITAGGYQKTLRTLMFLNLRLVYPKGVLNIVNVIPVKDESRR